MKCRIWGPGPGAVVCAGILASDLWQEQEQLPSGHCHLQASAKLSCIDGWMDGCVRVSGYFPVTSIREGGFRERKVLEKGRLGTRRTGMWAPPRVPWSSCRVLLSHAQHRLENSPGPWSSSA